jgi:hypothetical protein
MLKATDTGTDEMALLIDKVIDLMRRKYPLLKGREVKNLTEQDHRELKYLRNCIETLKLVVKNLVKV